MKRWFYVVDEAGREIPGSRRSVDDCKDWREIFAVEAELRAQAGEGSEVRDSALDDKDAALEALLGLK